MSVQYQSNLFLVHPWYGRWENPETGFHFLEVLISYSECMFLIYRVFSSCFFFSAAVVMWSSLLLLSPFRTGY